MHPQVRDLYKRFLFVGKDYPLGLSAVRDKAKTEFFKNRDLSDPRDICKAVGRGRQVVREMIGVIQLKKYRTLNQRYTPEQLQDALRDIHNEEVLRHLQQEEQESVQHKQPPSPT